MMAKNLNGKRWEKVPPNGCINFPKCMSNTKRKKGVYCCTGYDFPEGCEWPDWTESPAWVKRIMEQAERIRELEAEVAKVKPEQEEWPEVEVHFDDAEHPVIEAKYKIKWTRAQAEGYARLINTIIGYINRSEHHYSIDARRILKGE